MKYDEHQIIKDRAQCFRFDIADSFKDYKTKYLKKAETVINPKKVV